VAFAGSRPGTARSTVETVAFRLAGLPLSFLTTVIISRRLHPDGRGAFVLAILGVTIIAALFGNVGVAISHSIGKGADPRREVLVGSIVTAMSAIVVTPACYVALTWFLPDRFQAGRVAAFAIGGIMLVQVVGGALVAVGQLRRWNILQLGLQSSTLLLTLGFLAWSGATVGAASAAFVVAQWLAAGAAIVLAFRLPTVASGRRDSGAALFLFGLRVGLANVLSLINYRVELLLLERSQGVHAVGIYSVATSVGELLWVASASLSAAITSGLLAADDDDAAELTATAVRTALLVSVVLGVGVLVVGVVALPWVFGDDYASARASLVVLLPGIVLFSPAASLAVYFSTKLGRTRYAAIGASVSAIVTAAFAVVLIPNHGPVGAALSCSIGYAAGLTYAVLQFRSVTGLRTLVLVPSTRDMQDLATRMRTALRRTSSEPTIIDPFS
jgi:O-antigen/teichoic acid export membrane protein